MGGSIRSLRFKVKLHRLDRTKCYFIFFPCTTIAQFSVKRLPDQRYGIGNAIRIYLRNFFTSYLSLIDLNTEVKGLRDHVPLERNIISRSVKTDPVKNINKFIFDKYRSENFGIILCYPGNFIFGKHFRKRE